ncbi:glycoside hydrolase superfamily [Aspergillus pseudotamarii]|uniref:chitinase n=1 Tax=Aspergillus pseudotamarii TaxID=132259 RepID=A0A5N6SRG1_ASPPS|nr:glycoside hydrolase superfamily [Aspergillus pseudotamarii]KAE8136409.1 glycoside hydrolase superfamily [Aspergillus pseudotamarii]
MAFFQGPKWHLLSLLFAFLALQVLSQSVSGTECDSKKCSGASSKQRYVGYYATRHLEDQSCDTFEPSDINVEPFTHIYLENIHIGYTRDAIAAPFDDIDRRRWRDLVNLKIRKPSLKIYVSITPYAIDSGKPNPSLSDMVRSVENRTEVIDSIVKLLGEFKFDGLNFHYVWRDLWQGEPQNSVTFLKELRGLKNIDLAGMAEHLEHLSFISSDWPGDAVCKEEERWPEHGDSLNIGRSVRLLREANIDPKKLSPILDLGGREWKLQDPKCNTPGCPMTMRASRGKVTFESAKSLKQKADIANENCLGGLAVEMVFTGGPATLANPNDLDPSDTSMIGAPPTNRSRDLVDANAHLTETDTPSTTSTQSASLSSETSTSDSDTKGSTKGLSCHPAIGSVHVPIAQLDCDSNTTSTASHNPDAPVNVEESVPSPSLAAPHEAGTSDEPNPMGPKPTLTLAHRIGTPTDTTEKSQ